MRRAILIVCAVLAIVGTVSAQTDQPLRIAVLDLTSRNVPEGELLMLTERLRVELFSTGRFTVLERQQVEQILQEQGFQNSECAATECAVDIGRMIGAEKMVAGSIGSVGSQYSLIVRLIDVETGAIERTALRDCRCPIEDVMSNTVRTVAGELVGAMAPPRPTSELPEVVLQTRKSTPTQEQTSQLTPELHDSDMDRPAQNSARFSHRKWDGYVSAGYWPTDVSSVFLTSVSAALLRRLSEHLDLGVQLDAVYLWDRGSGEGDDDIGLFPQIPLRWNIRKHERVNPFIQIGGGILITKEQSYLLPSGAIGINIGQLGVVFGMANLFAISYSF